MVGNWKGPYRGTGLVLLSSGSQDSCRLFAHFIFLSEVLLSQHYIWGISNPSELAWNLQESGSIHRWLLKATLGILAEPPGTSSMTSCLEREKKNTSMNSFRTELAIPPEPPPEFMAEATVKWEKFRFIVQSFCYTQLGQEPTDAHDILTNGNFSCY